jgi:hypothetical protein
MKSKFSNINKGSVKRTIARIMSKTDPETIQTGMNWYTFAHSFTLSLSEKYSLSMIHAAGIVAALSPAIKWDQNRADAERIITLGEDATVSTYTPNKIKALLIREGQSPFEVLGGRKVTAFFINILDPSDDQYVTIDRWILRAIGIIDDKEQKSFFASDKKYNLVSEAIREKAKDYDMLPNQLQAVIWEHVRKAEG